MVPGERQGAKWGAGGGLGGGTEAGTEGAGGLPGQPPLQHFVLLLGRLAHHLQGERHHEMPCRAGTGDPSTGTGAMLGPPCLHGYPRVIWRCTCLPVLL